MGTGVADANASGRYGWGTFFEIGGTFRNGG